MSLYSLEEHLVMHYKLDDITNGIIDSSGNHYHGIVTGAISISANSGRYSYSTQIEENAISIINFPSLTNCTITWWGNHPDASTSVLTGQDASHYIRVTSYSNAGSPIIYKDGVAGSQISEGWHHYALVGANLSSWIIINISGNISDLRFYDTALSTNDIFQLYHIGAKIMNDQTLQTFELVEADETSINRRGQLICGELVEDIDSVTKFCKTDNIIKTHEIIEL